MPAVGKKQAFPKSGFLARYRYQKCPLYNTTDISENRYFWDCQSSKIGRCSTQQPFRLLLFENVRCEVSQRRNERDPNRVLPKPYSRKLTDPEILLVGRGRAIAYILENSENSFLKHFKRTLILLVGMGKRPNRAPKAKHFKPSYSRRLTDNLKHYATESRFGCPMQERATWIV